MAFIFHFKCGIPALWETNYLDFDCILSCNVSFNVLALCFRCSTGAPWWDMDPACCLKVLRKTVASNVATIRSSSRTWTSAKWISPKVFLTSNQSVCIARCKSQDTTIQSLDVFFLTETVWEKEKPVLVCLQCLLFSFRPTVGKEPFRILGYGPDETHRFGHLRIGKYMLMNCP